MLTPEIERKAAPKLNLFVLILCALFLARIGLHFVSIPLALLEPFNWVLQAIFLGVPIWCLYEAAIQKYSTRQTLILLVIGVASHALASFLLEGLKDADSLWSIVLNSAAQVGLILWCLGLGSLVSLKLKDKNLLIPVGIFLIFYDIFLVLTPIGITQKIMKQAPKIFETVAMQIPHVAQSVPDVAKPQIASYVGPADLIFLAMFFVALVRWGLEAKRTMLWMIPVLLAYLVFVNFTGQSMPALVPIGITTLIVNFKSFKLSKEEWAATGVVTIACAGLLTFSFLQRGKPAVPSQTAPSPVESRPAN